MNKENSPISDVRFSISRLKARAGRLWDGMLGRNPVSEMSNYIPVYKRIWEEAACMLGAGFREIADGFWEVRVPGRKTWIQNFRVSIDDPVVMALAGNKALCFEMMKEERLPVPDYRKFNKGTLETAERMIRESGQGLFVVKPANGTSGGRGVTTHVANVAGCRSASALASLYGEEFLIERMIPGESYRILVLNGEVIHASRRSGVRVTGDGVTSIRMLLGKIVGSAPGSKECWKRKDSVERKEIDCVLASQGLTLEDVPSAGTSILVSGRGTSVNRNVEVTTRYDEDVTNVIGQSMKDMATRAAGVIGSAFAGVDMITTDPNDSWEHGIGAIHEINTTPGLHNHYNLSRSADRVVPPAVPVLKSLLGIQ